MTKVKSLIAICILAAIVVTCTLSAAASLPYTTSVYWGPSETYAWAETVGRGPTNVEFEVQAWIHSFSTDDYSETISYSNGAPTTIATTGTVDVTYPTPIPIVEYGGYNKYK